MANSGIFNSSAPRDSAIINGCHLGVDGEGGIDLRKLRPGTILEVRTKNNTYTVIPQDSGEMMLWGHPEYCPEPTVVKGLGSTYVSGLFRENYLGPGMRLSFPSSGRRVSTSRIVDIQAKKQN